MALEDTFQQIFLDRMLDARLTQVLASTDPAVGSEASITVPGGEYWKVDTATVQLVASATVASRGVTIVVDDGTTILFRSQEPVSHLASETRRYSWQPGMGFTSGGGITFSGNAASPLLVMQPGWRIRTLTGNLQVGDDYTALSLVVRRFSPADLITVYEDIEREYDALINLED